MNTTPLFVSYTKALMILKPDETTELSCRHILQKLLEDVKDGVNARIKILHEPKRLQDYGAPDFKLTLHEGIVGYVENKAIGVNLNEELKSDQIQRYKKLSNNILLTNYVDWIWLRDGKEQARTSLCTTSELINPRFVPKVDQVNKLSELIQGFMSTAPEGISDPKKLAKALGQRGQLLKSYLFDELKRQEREDNRGKLFGLYNTFKRMVDHELKLDDFTDTFAQMLVYGLFMARLNSAAQKIDLFNVEKYISNSFELIHELVSFLKVLDHREYAETKWIVEEVLAVLNTMDMPEIVNALSFDKQNRKADPETARDPYIYFYEDFLAAYDKALKKARGVYYTPPPVVNFIIRAVNDILKDTFQIEDGLADHKKVTLLDFACGTGTFLLEAIRQIMDQTPAAKRELIVKEHILKNMYGFEYMIAPYTVAHLKLTQYLKDRGYTLESTERFKVYLTNTLEHFEVEDENLLPALSTESKQAKGVKDKPILVITGNPPYSYVSKNNGEWIKDLVKDYYFYDGKPLGEKNPKALQDDYVKFIRFAQWKMEQVDEGIVAIITNHSFLDSPTLRGLRQSLAKTFNQMYFLDLHGNTKKKEKTPEGGKDENVFDIIQGVSISLLVKSTSLSECQVKHSDLYGLRSEKYRFLYTNDLTTMSWKVFDTYSKRDSFNEDAYENSGYMTHLSVKGTFRYTNAGLYTARDSLAIDFDGTTLLGRLKEFVSLPPEGARNKYNLGDDSSDWILDRAQHDITDSGCLQANVKPILYRPFDSRFIYYTGKSRGLICRSRYDLMKHMLHDNICLVIGRQGQVVGSWHEWNLISVSNKLVDYNVFYRGGSSIIPQYLYVEHEFLGTKQLQRVPNVADEFITLLYERYNFQHEQIQNAYSQSFGYIYAILHSPTYRKKYRDFLKTDFPRIPFCEDYEVFAALAALGWRLIDAHLMKSSEPRQKYSHLGTYQVPGDNGVDKVFYADALQRLYINDHQYFAPVPSDLYAFHIGGYQVLNKYLKDRKGRLLTLDEINNVENIVRILAFTQEIMHDIDVQTRDWI